MRAGLGYCLPGVLLLCAGTWAQPAKVSKSAVTYDAGVKAAIEQNEIGICNTITQSWTAEGRVFGPYRSRRQCRIQFAAAKNKPGICRELNAFERNLTQDEVVTGGLDVEGICLQHLAWALRRLDLCEAILPAETFTPLQEIARDSCRGHAIYEVKQCSEGFRTQSWRNALENQEGCVGQIADNRRDSSFCENISSEGGRQRCVEYVKRLAEGRAKYPEGPAGF